MPGGAEEDGRDARIAQRERHRQRSRRYAKVRREPGERLDGSRPRLRARAGQAVADPPPLSPGVLAGEDAAGGGLGHDLEGLAVKADVGAAALGFHGIDHGKREALEDLAFERGLRLG